MNVGRFGLALGIVLFLMPAFAADVVVSDGDSLRIGDERVRLWGIDAPELDQRCEHGGKVYDCGKAAQAALSSLIGSRQVECEAVDRDRSKPTHSQGNLKRRPRASASAGARKAFVASSARRASSKEL